MKHLSLLWLLLTAAYALPAQAEFGGYRIGPERLDTLSTQYLQMQLVGCARTGTESLAGEYHIVLQYGQGLSTTAWLTPAMRSHNSSELLATAGLSGPGASWVSVLSAVDALNFMYRLGWDLVGVIPAANDPGRGMRQRPYLTLQRTSYMLKRR